MPTARKRQKTDRCAAAAATLRFAVLIAILVAQPLGGPPRAQNAEGPEVTGQAAPATLPSAQSSDPSAATSSPDAAAAKPPAPLATPPVPATTHDAPPPASTTAVPDSGLNSVPSPTPPASIGAEVLDHALKADVIVQLVMIGLIFAAFVTWTVWLKKTIELRSARAELRRDVHILERERTFAQALQQLRDGNGPVARFVQAAEQEIRLSDTIRGEGLKERIALQFERLEVAASRKIARGTGVLATIGSTAPFVGLFGTVWGIMNSFIGIENAHTTNLAVVAPGIAQALLATALGLVAAIPAVMTYNVLARATTNYRGLLGDASAQVMRLVSRDLDRAKLPLALAAE